MKIVRNISNIDDGFGEVKFRLNGHDVWVGKNTKSVIVNDAAIPIMRGDVYRLACAIVLDKPGIRLNITDPDVQLFLKHTECI
jgi:hypothetical protein